MHSNSFHTKSPFVKEIVRKGPGRARIGKLNQLQAHERNAKKVAPAGLSLHHEKKVVCKNSHRVHL